MFLAICRRDGTGRRAGFKIPWWQHRMGSTPIAGTSLKTERILFNPGILGGFDYARIRSADFHFSYLYSYHVLPAYQTAEEKRKAD
jgi:hypothetical protein